MYIRAFQIRNYKVFIDTARHVIGPGFTLILGKNNSGKTSLLEALSLAFESRPHRSSRTIPFQGAYHDPNSVATVEFVLRREELPQLLPGPHLNVALPYGQELTLETAARHFIDLLNASPEIVLVYRYVPGNLPVIELQGYGLISHMERLANFTVAFDDGQARIVGNIGGSSGGSFDQIFGIRLGAAVRSRIYAFRAERFSIDHHKVGDNPVLLPDARNLAQVLNRMQTTNPPRWEVFKELVSTVFPEILEITVPVQAGTDAYIHLWLENPAYQREDLAARLSESGTGTGQVLAILYVILNALEPHIVLIDEPHSFLHPGAIRKLLEILHRYERHQYICSTHSPVALAAVEPSAVLVSRREGVESRLERVALADARSLRTALLGLGVRFADVFGSERVLWVEGTTEEECFPLILESLVQSPLFGTKIIGLTAVGDLEGRDAERVWEIYRRLGESGALLPPALGFILDREDRKAAVREELERRSGGRITFLARRMFENYLLRPNAIAAIMNAIEGFRPESAVSGDEIARWFDVKGQEKRFLKGRDGRALQGHWERIVAGDRILQALFAELSETRVYYDKVRHGRAIVEWLRDNEPEALSEVANLLRRFCQQAPEDNDVARGSLTRVSAGQTPR